MNNIYKSILEADLLIIDDLGTETLNHIKASELFTIINTRLLNQNHKITKTIISTNLNINNIFKYFLQIVLHFIHGLPNQWMAFPRSDLRQRN